MASECSMWINDSFYKNVFLLMQVVPASCECIRHFKKGMFNKPNTSGFIHTSHYLLSVNNAQHFQKMVTWPIINKTNEKLYRIQIKEYLEILRNENPDINIPPILMSHLLRASGIKFLIIMWKISEISLRAYIMRKYQITLLQAPNVGNINEITQIYFSNINKKRDIAISEFHGKTKIITQSLEHYMKSESNGLKKVQTDIFETKDNIETCAHMAPVSPFIAKRLINIEDSEIIELWRTSIHHSIIHLYKKNATLNKLKMLSNSLYSLLLSSCISSKTFDGNSIPKIDKIILPCFNNNIQHVSSGLYTNNCLVFHTLLLILNQILKQVHCYLKIYILLDLSSYKSRINEFCETMKSMEEIFEKNMEQISDTLYNMECSLQKKSINFTSETNLFDLISHETILTSPKINFSDTKSMNDKELFQKLDFYPLEGKYKHLFKRYKHDLFNSSKQSAIFQFNSNIENNTNWKSPQRQPLIDINSSPNRINMSPRYYRLFSTSSFQKNLYRGTNAVSTPKPLQITETPKKSNTEISKAQTVTISTAMKNIFDLSCKITNVVTSLYNSESSNSSMS